MNLLALDTSTEILSLALGSLDAEGHLSLHGEHTGPGGAQSSASLLPAIQQLLEQAGWSLRQLDLIAFGAGPGSFTGLRTACSVAQGLALGVNLPVLPVDTLLCVAEQARTQTAGLAEAAPTIAAAMDARMDEIYLGLYRVGANGLSTTQAPVLIAPHDLSLPAATLLAGNARAAYADRLPAATLALPHVTALPSAQAMLRLVPGLLAQGLSVDPAQALPRYVRDKVAKTTAERMAAAAPASQPGAGERPSTP